MLVKFKNLTDVTYTHLKNVVCKDELRPAMSGVYIDLKESKLVATDAHVLIAYPIEIIENDSDKEGVIVPIEYFNKLRYMVPLPSKRKGPIELEYILTDTYAEIHFHGEMIYRRKYIDFTYPKWNSENVMVNPADYPDKPKELGVNINVLQKMISGIPKSNTGIYKMETTSASKCILFTSNNSDYTTPIKAIVMPCSL